MFIIYHTTKYTMFYNTQTIEIYSVHTETRQKTYNSPNHDYMIANDTQRSDTQYITYRVCIINNDIEIVETLLTGPSWHDVFINHVGKNITFYRFSIGSLMDTLYAFEVDGIKTYMNGQIINAVIIPSMIIGSTCVMTYVLAKYVFKK